MTTKHTPGPWRIETVRSSGYGQRRIVSDNIARDWQSRDDVHDPRGESVASGIYVEADARLIAAAPDLLAALEWIANDTQFEAPRVAAVARAAIARAKGGEL